MARAKKSRRPARDDGYTAFMRGAVTTALLTGLAGQGRTPSRRVLKLALEGGIALSAGTVAARALRRGDYGPALTAAALGAAGLVLTRRAFSPVSDIDCDKEHSLGQEEER